MLAAEYERLLSTLNDRNREIENWRAKYTHLELSLQKLGDLEKRLAILKDENAMLKRQLEDKTNELDEWVVRYGDIDGPQSEIE